MTAIFAHRGCHGVPAPRENTIEAFVAARRAGADGVELDARATADGALAVHHDRHVPGLGDLANVSASQLPDEVPLLPDVLDSCRGLRVNVEIKGGAAEGALVGRFLLAERPPEVLVSSFVPESLVACLAVAPAVPAGLLVDWRTDPMIGLAHARALGCATFHPFVTQVDTGLVEAARQAGLGLHVWTVNADEDIALTGRLGVEAVITDRVDAAIRILRPAAPAGHEPSSPPAGNGADPSGSPAGNGAARAG